MTLTAAPNAGSVFVRWEDVACEQGEQAESCTVAVDGEMTAAAVFELVVTLSVKKGGGGTVTSDLGEIDCGEICDADFAAGTEVTLTAVPDDGWVFAGWDKVCVGMTSPCTVVVTESTVAVAEFREAGSEGPGLAEAPGSGAGTRAQVAFGLRSLDAGRWRHVAWRPAACAR